VVRRKVVNTNIIFFGFTQLGLEAYTTLNAGIKQLKQHDIRVVSGYVCHSTIKAT
jgi:hypothetical protein